jgi:hypothetical protein
MQKSRVFVSQETLDRWLSEERVEVDGDVMTLLPERRRFSLATAVHFLREVAEGGDEMSLVGKVKDIDQVLGFGGDYSSGSVVLGDNAYEVVDGFLGAPIVDARAANDTASDGVPAGSSLAAATAAALGDASPPSGEFDLLSHFFTRAR